MLAHVRGQSLLIAQKAHVAQLIELVVADDLRVHARLHVCDVRRACRHGRDARARERHLARGGELEAAIGVASFIARGADIKQLVLLLGCIVEVMNAVGVVPENAEIFGCARHGRQAAHHLIGIRHAAGVAVLRHAPDALHRRIVGNKALHLVHVGPVGGYGNGDHGDAERLGHAEMPIVAGAGAQPLHLIKFAPGRVAQRAERPAARHGVVHDVQA